MEYSKGKITILSDNIAPGHSDVLAEHGFSAYVETENGSFLFDTGKGKTIVYNSSILKKGLKEINKVILSHAHSDHTGGLPEVLLMSGIKDVYAHPYVFKERFRYKETGKEYGGIPYRKEYLEKLGARFIFNREPIEIERGVYLSGEVPRRTSFEMGDMSDRYLIEMGQEVPDRILDDQSIFIKAKEGIVILAGCAHAGIINLIYHAFELLGMDRIYGIVGGTHIGFSGELQREETIRALKDIKFNYLLPSHCTGFETNIRLWQEFPLQFKLSHVGATFEY